MNFGLSMIEWTDSLSCGTLSFSCSIGSSSSSSGESESPSISMTSFSLVTAAAEPFCRPFTLPFPFAVEDMPTGVEVVDFEGAEAFRDVFFEGGRGVEPERVEAVRFRADPPLVVFAALVAVVDLVAVDFVVLGKERAFWPFSGCSLAMTSLC